jgi:hypothetical protein
LELKEVAMKKALQLSEQALRLALAIAVLALAAWTASPKPTVQGGLNVASALPKPGSVMEW